MYASIGRPDEVKGDEMMIFHTSISRRERQKLRPRGKSTAIPAG